MLIMDKFLAASKDYMMNLGNRRAKVIIGNTTCDLDSAVCAMVQGYLEYCENKHSEVVVVPVLNVTRENFRLKTEVIHHLEKCNLPRDLLTFRDEIDLTGLQAVGKLELLLVDHHVLSVEDSKLADAVCEVIDHRPQDPRWTWPGRRVNISIVGSCASLVSCNILKRRADILPSVCHLLRGPILIDTFNFSNDADRATPLDRVIMAELERVGCVTEVERCQLYREILEAKINITNLTADELLIKDLKVVHVLPISVFPILVKDFLELGAVEEALEFFCSSRSYQVAILLGMDLTNSSVRKDIALYSLDDDRLINQLTVALISSTNPNLQLVEIKRSLCGTGKLVLYKQENVRPSRKQILPILQRTLLG